MRLTEEHCCDEEIIAIDKYLQIGKGIGKNILAVGESPAGNGWRVSGRAFFTPDGKVVPTGKNFLINLKQIDENLELENISFTEIAKCFVANNRRILRSCAAKVWPHFISQIEYINPKLIILMGKHTTEIFSDLAGVKLDIGQIARVKINDKEYSVLPIYHPSPLNPLRKENEKFINHNALQIRKLVY